MIQKKSFWLALTLSVGLGAQEPVVEPPPSAGTDAAPVAPVIEAKPKVEGATPENRLQVLTKRAEGGDLEGLYLLGLVYERGEDGVTQDEQRAYGFFAAAARKGHGHAAFRMGEALMTGRGVTRDPEAAVGAFARAVEAGIVEANLAQAKAMAMGKDPNRKEMVGLYRRAAWGGIAEGQTELGSALVSGFAGEKRVEDGCIWLATAILGGSRDAKALFRHHTEGMAKEEVAILERIAKERYQWVAVLAAMDNLDLRRASQKAITGE